MSICNSSYTWVLISIFMACCFDLDFAIDGSANSKNESRGETSARVGSCDHTQIGGNPNVIACDCQLRRTAHFQLRLRSRTMEGSGNRILSFIAIRHLLQFQIVLVVLEVVGASHQTEEQLFHWLALRIAQRLSVVRKEMNYHHTNLSLLCAHSTVREGNGKL